jgi:UDPglucose 6-dehydrogenase
MKIAVVGTGYVGLVTGTCFAETGNSVTCVDIDVNKVESLRNGKITIYEPGLEILFKHNLAAGRLNFTTNLAEGIKGAQIIFLALPTPPGEDGSADLKYILKVADDLGPLLDQFTVLVDKSTVPVGTAELVRERVIKGAKVEFDVVSNPEFLREGVAVDDFMKPDRVVIGTSNDKAAKLMYRLYQPLLKDDTQFVVMDERSAEMTKYAANAFLAAKITFMNEIANLCEKVGANVEDVRKGIGSDHRIGAKFLNAGIGYGGSCFPKDVQALARTSADFDYKFQMLESVMAVNAEQKTKMVKAITNHFGEDLTGKKIALWGLAFKPYTDDIREAPSLENIRELTARGASIVAYDAEGAENVKRLLGDQIGYANSMYEAADGADCVLVVTEWPEFRTPDFGQISSLLKNKLIFDGRNMYELEQMAELGYTYHSIGRKVING